VALLIEYLAPLLVALWARFFYKETVRRRIWVALALALTGLALIVNVFGGGTSLSTAGILYALAGAFAYATYVLLAEHVVGNRDPVSLLAWGFLLASVFWAILDPWWSFPGHLLTESASLQGNLHAWHLPVWVLAALMILFGTVVPFFLLISALRHLPATRVGIVAMLEPVERGHRTAQRARGRPEDGGDARPEDALTQAQEEPKLHHHAVHAAAREDDTDISPLLHEQKVRSPVMRRSLDGVAAET